MQYALGAKTQAEVGIADAPVLRETNSRPGKELCAFDLADCRIDQLAKLSTLLFRNRSQQSLNLRDAFHYESHNGNIGDSSDPGVADVLPELELPRARARKSFRVTVGQVGQFHGSPNCVNDAKATAQ